MNKNRKAKLLKIVCAGVIGIIAVVCFIGSCGWIQIIELEHISHNATLEQLWTLWDFDQRKQWDDSLEFVEADGAFELGQTGLLKLKEQPPRKFKITEFEKHRRYTDRFYLPLGGKMDWRHTLEETATGIKVTWDIWVNGPSALLLVPIMRMILKEELPRTVEKYIHAAEDSLKN